MEEGMKAIGKMISLMVKVKEVINLIIC